jgi:hypothetical protein
MMCDVFWVVATVISLYYAVRGVVIQTRLVGDQNTERSNLGLREWTKGQRVFVHYVQDFLFNFVCAMAGFAALSLDWDLVHSHDISEISTGGAIFAVFLAFVAFTGASGKLPELIHRGKLPPSTGSGGG